MLFPSVYVCVGLKASEWRPNGPAIKSNDFPKDKYSLCVTKFYVFLVLLTLFLYF